MERKGARAGDWCPASDEDGDADAAAGVAAVASDASTNGTEGILFMYLDECVGVLLPAWPFLTGEL